MMKDNEDMTVKTNDGREIKLKEYIDEIDNEQSKVIDDADDLPEQYSQAESSLEEDLSIADEGNDNVAAKVMGTMNDAKINKIEMKLESLEKMFIEIKEKLLDK